MYYVNQIIDRDREDSWAELVLLGHVPKGEKKNKNWLFFFLPQDGAIGMSSLQREALVNAFSMFIQLDLVRPEKWSQF